MGLVRLFIKDWDNVGDPAVQAEGGRRPPFRPQPGALIWGEPPAL